MVRIFFKMIRTLTNNSTRKVAMVLEELNLPYKVNYLEFNEVKNESYVKITPNGRLPTLKDPNTGITLWEVR
jgi:glutathione S-transferase